MPQGQPLPLAQGLTLNGTDFDVDDLAGEVTGPTSATVIANNAVTTAKIANATILAEDLNQMGATNDQVLKWNGTAWAPAADEDSGAMALANTNIFIGDATNTPQPRTLSGDATINNTGVLTIEDDAVNSAKIANGTITNEDISATPADAIDGSKIIPVFTTDVSTTGNLQVDGNVNVTGTHSPVPDYVFQKYFLGKSDLKENYDFQTLAQIEAFVKKHHHLPGIKSAEEVKQDGFWNLSESNLQNLEKIEELFLHTIVQEKKIEQLTSENQSLSAELQSLRKDMDEIKALLKNKN